MTNREQRAIIAKETMKILKRGFYQNQQKKIINIREAYLAAKTGSLHYSAEMFIEVLPERNRISGTQQKSYPTIFEVRNETTLYGASRLINQEGIERVLCLNFASAKNPGGGFLNGS